jgi:hypothetical protein
VPSGHQLAVTLLHLRRCFLPLQNSSSIHVIIVTDADAKVTCDVRLIICVDSSAQQREDIAADVADGMGGAGHVTVRFSQEGGESCDGDEIKCVMIDQHIALQVNVLFVTS